MILIVSAAALDVFYYYQQLLDGGVNAILDLEKRYPEIQASTKIKEAVGGGIHVIWFFYGLPVLTLGGFATRAWSLSNKN